MTPLRRNAGEPVSEIVYYPSAWTSLFGIGAMVLGLLVGVLVPVKRRLGKALAVSALVVGGGTSVFLLMMRPTPNLALGTSGFWCKGVSVGWGQVVSIEYRPRFGYRPTRSGRMRVEFIRSDGRIVVFPCSIELLAPGPRRFEWWSSEEIARTVERIGKRSNPGLRLNNWP